MTIDWSRCLVYGATGYTGELIAERAASLGISPILGGRSRAKVEALAERMSMPSRVVGLDDPSALDNALEDVDVVIHAAGPFSKTSKPMVDACIRTGTHYLDITGEIDVFEACAGRDGEATAAGVMLMPGVGFDVVPSDCLAAHVATRLPDATHLAIAISGIGSKPSHGTAATAVEGLGRPNLVRRDGEIREVPMGSLRQRFDFGRGPESALGIPWGDVSTAYHSTKIPNIDVYMRLPTAAMAATRVLRYASGLLDTKPVKRFLTSRITPGGPSQEARSRAFSIVVAEARRGDEVARARLRVADGYTLTAHSALEIARRVLDGAAQPGFRTPSMVFGPDFPLDLGGEREDL